MKIKILLLLTILASACNANPQMESELIARIQKMIDERRPLMIHEIYKYEDDEPVKGMLTAQFFQLMIVQGVEKMEYIDIFEVVAKEIASPIERNGKHYTMNTKPYKMLSIQLKDAALKDSSLAGKAYLVGEIDGRLWISGQKEIKNYELKKK